MAEIVTGKRVQAAAKHHALKRIVVICPPSRPLCIKVGKVDDSQLPQSPICAFGTSALARRRALSPNPLPLGRRRRHRLLQLLERPHLDLAHALAADAVLGGEVFQGGGVFL